MKELSAKHWQIAMLGESPFRGITSIKYSYKQESEAVMALGESQPYSNVEKEVEYEGELVFAESAYNRLIYKLPPGALITDIPIFDIVAQQVSKETSLRQKMIIAAKFTGSGKEIKSGDGVILVSCPLYIHSLIENAPIS